MDFVHYILREFTAAASADASVKPESKHDTAKPSVTGGTTKDELMIPREEGEPEVEVFNGGEDPILIFSEENLKQLQRRTEELKTERSMQKNKFK